MTTGSSVSLVSSVLWKVVTWTKLTVWVYLLPWLTLKSAETSVIFLSRLSPRSQSCFICFNPLPSFSICNKVAWKWAIQHSPEMSKDIQIHTQFKALPPTLLRVWGTQRKSIESIMLVLLKIPPCYQCGPVYTSSPLWDQVLVWALVPYRADCESGSFRSHSKPWLLYGAGRQWSAEWKPVSVIYWCCMAISVISGTS